MPKRKSFRSELSTALAKTLAYYEHGNLDSARQWASVLQQKLIDSTLLIDTRPRTGHNDSQSENAITSKTKGAHHG